MKGEKMERGKEERGGRKGKIKALTSVQGGMEIGREVKDIEREGGREGSEEGKDGGLEKKEGDREG